MTWRPDYLTTAIANAYLRISDAVDDPEVAGWVTAASRAIDKRCNRQFGQLAAAATFTYRRTPYYDPELGLWVLEIDDVQDTTGLLLNGQTLAAAGAVLLPDDAITKGKPYERIGMTTMPLPQAPGVPQLNTVFAKFGWLAFPAQVVAAAKLQIARWNFRRDAPQGVAGSPDQGSEIRLLAKLDPDVATTLMGLSRRRRVG